MTSQKESESGAARRKKQNHGPALLKSLGRVEVGSLKVVQLTPFANLIE